MFPEHIRQPNCQRNASVPLVKVESGMLYESATLPVERLRRGRQSARQPSVYYLGPDPIQARRNAIPAIPYRKQIMGFIQKHSKFSVPQDKLNLVPEFHSPCSERDYHPERLGNRPD